MPRGIASSRYSCNGLADATFNTNNYTFLFPSNLSEALGVANRYLDKDAIGIVGTFTGPTNYLEQPSVYQVGQKLFAVTHYYDTFPRETSLILSPRNINMRGRKRIDVEFLMVTELIPKQKQQDEDCPPPENCEEKWITKTLYVSARPVENAIEIPVAFKKLVCEGESADDPEVDCEELLRALEDSVKSGSVPGMMGLSAYTGDYPPDWCKDCEEKLVKASAYVTEYAVAGSKPFKVKVKVLVCETGAEPTIDCDEVIKALGAGMRGKKGRTMNGLSEATAINKKAAKPGEEFDTEADTLDPTRRATQAGFPWWMWLVIGGGVVYAARKL